MKSWMMRCALAASVLAAGTARADQCQWVDAATARKAEAILTQQPKVIAFCEPCGDNAPGVPEIAKTVDVSSPQNGYWEVQVNGKAVDLAYTFVQTPKSHDHNLAKLDVQTSKSRYHNLAKLVGCEADGVSSSLAIAAETPNGVLIKADDKAPEPPAPVIAPATVVTTVPTPPPPPAPSQQPTQVIIYTQTPAIPWLLVALTGLCGFGSCLFALLAIKAVRRRRNMRPRAENLTTGRADRADL